MRPTTIPTLLVLLLGSSAIAQSTLAEDALRQSGAAVSYPSSNSVVGTPDTAMVVPALPAPAPVATPAPVAVAPAAVEDEEPRPTRRFRILVGVTDWHWEEELNSKIVLAEGGMIPSIRLEYTRMLNSVELGGSLAFSYGPIEYDGALQDGTDFKSNSHYSIVDIEGFIVVSRFLELLNVHTRGFMVEPGLKYGFQSWVRTLASEKYKEPGDHGYVETWDMGVIQPVIGLRVPFGTGRSYARVEAGVRFPIGNANNEASDFVVEGRTMDAETVVHPKPQTAYRVQGMVALGHVLLELEYLAQDFAKSKMNGDGFMQPGSYLDRLDARIGLEF